jgi:hypothetical protein
MSNCTHVVKAFVIVHYIGGIYRITDTETLTLGISLFRKNPPNNANAAQVRLYK